MKAGYSMADAKNPNTQLIFDLVPEFMTFLYHDETVADPTICPECQSKLRTVGNYYDVYVPFQGVILRMITWLHCDNNHNIFMGSRIPF